MMPGAATRWTSSKFRRDCSSFQVVLPGDSGTKCSGALLMVWHTTHRVWRARREGEEGGFPAAQKNCCVAPPRGGGGVLGFSPPPPPAGLQKGAAPPQR